MAGPGAAAATARTKQRRGHGKSIVATARKLAVLFRCTLARGEDYAHQQPSLIRKKLRRLEITASAWKYTRRVFRQWGGVACLMGAPQPQLTKIACSRLVPAARLSRSGIRAKPLPLGRRIQKRARGDSVPTITSPAYLASEGAGAM
jgi:hypothetical protein